MSVIGTATSAVSNAFARFDDAAAAITRQDLVEDRKTDLAKDAAAMIALKTEVQANAAVARTGSRTVGALVDILA